MAGQNKRRERVCRGLCRNPAILAQIIGISVDSVPANRRFAQDLSVSFPLLSDFKREVSKTYGILNEERGWARRTTFVVDKGGQIRHIEQGRSAIDPSGALKMCEYVRPKLAQ